MKAKEKLEALFDEHWQLYKPWTAQSGQSNGAQVEANSGNASSGAVFYVQKLIKKLNGPNGRRGIIKPKKCINSL